jgi:hypothetical protein
MRGLQLISYNLFVAVCYRHLPPPNRKQITTSRKSVPESGEKLPRQIHGRRQDLGRHAGWLSTARRRNRSSTMSTCHRSGGSATSSPASASGPRHERERQLASDRSPTPEPEHTWVDHDALMIQSRSS